MQHIASNPFRAAAGGGIRRFLGVLIALVLAGLVAFWLGPRNAFGPAEPTARPSPPQDIAALPDWLAHSESAFSDIKPGNAKGIVWADDLHQRTPWAVVYVHGFSASRLETAPLAEAVAQLLHANVFYTRLRGHGRSDPNAMGQATTQDWMADTLEAARIGQTLGQRVLMISCSTGGTLAAWLATTEQAQLVAAQVMISPNFGPKDKRSEIINMPWGKKLAMLIQGPRRSWQPTNDAEANAWTSSYPTAALFPMMALVKHVRDSDLSAFQTPALVLYSEQDQTVDPKETLAAFARLGSEHKTIEAVTYSHSEGQHVLAGAIKDPAAVQPMADSIVRWLNALHLGS